MITLFSVLFFLYIIWDSFSPSRSLMTSNRGSLELMHDLPFPAHTHLESCKLNAGTLVVL